MPDTKFLKLLVPHRNPLWRSEMKPELTKKKPWKKYKKNGEKGSENTAGVTADMKPLWEKVFLI